MNVDICLVNPPQVALWNPLSYPPLGLLYLAAALEAEDVPVTIHNQPHRTLEDQQDEIPEADIYGITATTANIPATAELVRFLRQRRPAAIVVGGIHATVAPEETLELTGADYAWNGEGEELFPVFCRDPSRFERIIETGRIYNLDALPLPARHLLPRDVICDTSGIHSGEDKAKQRHVASARGTGAPNGPATTIITSRGCPYRCTFCCKSRITEGVRYRSPENILGELLHLRDTYGIHHFRIVDDAVTLDRHRFDELMELTTGRELYFTTILRADSLKDLPMVQRMYAGGVRVASFGVESGSQAILDRVNKRESIAEIEQAIQWCKEAGVFTKVFLIFGLPGETLETVDQTKAFMRRAQPDSYTLSSFQPLPGSDIYEHPDKYGLEPLFEHGDYGNFWFYYEPDDAESGFHYRMPLEVRQARGDLIRYLRKGEWKG